MRRRLQDGRKEELALFHKAVQISQCVHASPRETSVRLQEPTPASSQRFNALRVLLLKCFEVSIKPIK